MNAIEVLLHQLDDAWGYKWESVLSSIEGVSQEEALWQPLAYAHEPQDEGWPAKGSILWQVAHISDCNQYYTQCIQQRPQKVVDDVVRQPSNNLEEEKVFLAETHAKYRETVAGLSAEHLSEIVREEMSLHQFIAMNIRHSIWHAGQIVVVQRLYKASK